MPKFSVSRSIQIDRPVADVFATVRDFNTWNSWSPWMLMDPNAHSQVHGSGKEVGDKNSWEGQRVGVGEIEHQAMKEPDRLEMGIRFLKPWKSTAQVEFDFESVGDGGDATRVTWTMHSSLPFFMFFMKGMMMSMIGSDYDRGLKMLKDLLETGAVPSHLEFGGAVTYPGCQFIGRRRQARLEQLDTCMKEDFTRLTEQLESSGLACAGPPFVDLSQIRSEEESIRLHSCDSCGFPRCEPARRSLCRRSPPYPRLLSNSRRRLQPPGQRLVRHHENEIR